MIALTETNPSLLKVITKPDDADRMVFVVGFVHTTGDYLLHSSCLI